MAGDTQITIVGNLVSDPELRFTPSGAAVCNFRIASTPRSFDKTTNEWKDGEALFLTCNVWRQPAENCAESLQKGMRVIVQGSLRQRSYDTKEGEKRTVFEVEAEDVAVSLKFATAKVTKAQGGSGGGQGQQRQQSGGQQQNGGGWGSAPPQQRQPQNAGGGWGAPQGQQSGGFSDEPPF
jgi:single-strand DNA-binding protein